MNIKEYDPIVPNYWESQIYREDYNGLYNITESKDSNGNTITVIKSMDNNCGVSSCITEYYKGSIQSIREKIIKKWLQNDI